MLCFLICTSFSKLQAQSGVGVWEGRMTFVGSYSSFSNLIGDHEHCSLQFVWYP